MIFTVHTAQGVGALLGSAQTIPDGHGVQVADPPSEYCNVRKITVKKVCMIMGLGHQLTHLPLCIGLQNYNNPVTVYLVRVMSNVLWLSSVKYNKDYMFAAEQHYCPIQCRH